LKVDCVFFTHQDSVALCKRYSTVFIIDCTYKTMTPRKRLLARLTTELYSANARVGSLIARLTEVIERTWKKGAKIVKKGGEFKIFLKFS
jgi:hypothetical protein